MYHVFECDAAGGGEEMYQTRDGSEVFGGFGGAGRALVGKNSAWFWRRMK